MCIRDREESELPDDSLDGMFRALEPLTPVNNEIKRCILSEEEVSDDASPGLRKVRRAMKGIGDKIHTQLNSILNSSRTYLQDAVITMRAVSYTHLSGLISLSQFNKLTALNRKSFSPFLAEIMPEPVDITSIQR